LSLPAAPVVFKRELESLEVVEGDRAVLTCETSSAEGRVTWRKGSLLLTDGHKYSLERQGSACVLVVSMLRAEDSGQYTCDTGDSQTTATLTVKGNRDNARGGWIASSSSSSSSSPSS